MLANKDPAGGMPARRARAPAVGALIVALLLVAGCAASPSPTPSPSPTLEPTLEPTPSPTAVANTPMQTVDELLDALYAAINAGDSAGLWAISANWAQHAVWYVDAATASETAHFVLEGYDLADSGIVSISVDGEPIVAGDAVAVPVTYTYADQASVGFDVLTLVHAGGGLLLGDGLTLYGIGFLSIDEAAAIELLANQIMAWNADDADGVLAAMTETAQMWEGAAGSSRVTHAGADLRTFVEDSLWFDIEATADATVHGIMVVTPNRLASSDETGIGLTAYWISGTGKIGLQVWVPGD